MPTFLTPGVYVEEVPAVLPVEARRRMASAAAFIGLAPGGPLNVPMEITGWASFSRLFADPEAFWNGPFREGAYLAHAVFGFFANGGQRCWVLRVDRPEEAIDDAGGRRGIEAFSVLPDIDAVCVPDLAPPGGEVDESFMRRAQAHLIAHAEREGRMVILDPPPDQLPQDVLEWRMNSAGYDSKFATLYWPWIEVTDPLTRRPALVPPSGHVAGIWARTDRLRGVHAAPANQAVLGAHGLAFAITGMEQGHLNRVGINCIRSFPARGIRVWGARTLSSDPEWRYIHHRRFVDFVSRSLMDELRWAVFEPNDPALWVEIRVAAESFLSRLWREGALLGATPAEAFFVRCDESLNPPEVVEAGQVLIEVGIALVRPAEFVVFRLAPTGANPTEVAV